MASDPEVTRYLSWLPHRTVEETRSVIAGLFNVGVDHTWLITLRDSGEPVGQIGYLTEPHAVQVGYALGRRFWGRGLAGEALRLLLDHLRATRRCIGSRRGAPRQSAFRAGAGTRWIHSGGTPGPGDHVPQPGGRTPDALLYGMALR